MTKRNRFWPCIGIGLLLLVLLASSSGAQARISPLASGAGPEPVLPQQTWTFIGWARTEGTNLPVSGVSFALYGSRTGEAPGDVLLASGATDATGNVNLVTDQDYPYYFVVHVVPSGYRVTSNACTGDTCHNPGGSWMRWQDPSMGTYYSQLWLTRDATATPTPKCWLFQGRVYEGDAGNESQPMQNVTVSIHGAHSSYPSPGTLIRSTTTNSDGWYGLQVCTSDGSYEFYHIRETDPATHYSVGATSVGGVKKTDNWIQYVVPLDGKTLTGNKFWDKRSVSSTATRTATLTSTPQFTVTLHVTPTPTATASPTRPGASTPTWTPTQPTGRTLTPTPTRPVGPTSTPMHTLAPGSGADLEIIKTMAAPPSQPVAPGSKIQYNVLVWHNGPDTARSVVVTDTLPAGMVFSAASGGCSLVQHGPPNDIVRCDLGDLATFPQGTIIWLQAAVDERACGELVNQAVVHSDTFDPNLANNQTSLPVEIGPCRRQELQVTKTLIDPPGGVAAVGDTVRFKIEVANPNNVAVAGFSLEDRFKEAEFDFLSAMAPPDVSTTDGVDHLLVWQNLTAPPSGVVAFHVNLRAKLAGVSASNCTYYVMPVNAGDITGVLGPASCASVRVRPLEGRHFVIRKAFAQPSNHVASVGDLLSFETTGINVGTETAQKVQVYDHLSPPSVSSMFPIGASWSLPFATGDWAKLGATFKPQTAALPAVNTAEWTVTWPDGSKETKSAQDYVYILEGEEGKGLFISKRLMNPMDGAVVSDTVTFRVTITNVTGVDLPVLSLSDSFQAQCISFDSASLPPDSMMPGALSWNNVGPLPLGASISLDIRFHADGVCPSTLNCAQASYQMPGGPPQFSASCAPVTIRGERPQLVIDKRRISPSPVMLGAPVEWEVELTNVGGAPLPVVPLHDRYQSAFFDFHSAIPLPNHTDPTHGLLEWNNMGPLGPGQSKTVTIRLISKSPGLGVLNCAESYYTVGSSNLAPSGCANVDIVSEPPSIRIEKVRLAQDPDAPVAVGDTVVFSVTVANTGVTPLTNLVVQDTYDPGCMAFVKAPGMATQAAPGLLRWDIPALGVGDALAWELIFRLDDQCSPASNCVIVDAHGPAGEPVHDEACAEFRTVPPEPGLVVRKRLAAPAALPVPGTVMRFEIQVQNAGNNTLNVVRVVDHYDVGCLGYVSAMPGPDGVNPAAGEVWWNNVGPLAPGQGRMLNVFLRLIEPCDRFANCAQAFWMVDGEPHLEVGDCVELGIRTPWRPIHLPLLMKQYPMPGPVATPTRIPSGTSTATPARTPTATLPAGTLIFADDFNRGVLTGWTANRGNWTNPGTYMQGVHTLGGAWDIKSVSGGDFVYEGTVTLRSGNAAGLTFRSNSDGLQSYDLLMDYADQEIKLSRRSPYVKMVGAISQGSVEYDRAYQLKVVVRGNQLDAYVDGQLKLTTTDSTFASGQFGVTIFQATAEFDDLRALTLP